MVVKNGELFRVKLRCLVIIGVWNYDCHESSLKKVKLQFTACHTSRLLLDLGH